MGKDTERLFEIVESFFRKDHYYVDEDCWYSCPAHPDYCGKEEHICQCGLVEDNAKVMEALEIIKRKNHVG